MQSTTQFSVMGVKVDFNQFPSLGTFVTPEGDCIWGMAKRAYCKVGFSSGILARSLGFHTGEDLSPHRIIIPKSDQTWHRPGSWGWYRHVDVFQVKSAVEDAAKCAVDSSRDRIAVCQ